MQGVWSGMVIGGTMMQTLILLWVTCRTDWNKEVIHPCPFPAILLLPCMHVF
jgi:MATE family multidrug resistance protein